jgi:hypothetical protein
MLDCSYTTPVSLTWTVSAGDTGLREWYHRYTGRLYLPSEGPLQHFWSERRRHSGTSACWTVPVTLHSSLVAGDDLHATAS